MGMHATWAWITVEKRPTMNDFEGWLYLQSLLPSQGIQAFAKQVSDYTKSRFDFVVAADAVDLTYSAALHDAIVLYAHATTKLLSQGGDVHNGTE